MKNINRLIEKGFEKLTSFVMAVLGNSITFVLAVFAIIYWLSSKVFFEQSLHECIRDVLHGVIFLSLFVIQKSFNRFSAVLHLKVNELVASHERASNTVINTGDKTESEINKLSREYDELTVDE